ncbi:MAG: DUF4443 domain-containing protein [Crenarchaeota archaeon]|nr:MAG: DUF4443 domain-containing protein [Thermoproteota archaeon]RDJ34366.1 MAG: DUF4443 domain-containing protein [Thermoproteota archaeon]RDJ37171.1 MAG: DUF4443 domain-containing protein [Thermoproteota archaeon]RDJ37946.1 MAG: DUF4443 domain-containing protein [Thermoproteota archaeon]
MHQQIKTLQNVVSRKGSSKVLTFSIPHVFKALQLLKKDQYVSRSSFCKFLHLGEGAVKTLILHLKEAGLVDSTKSGTYLTPKGDTFVSKILAEIPAECTITKNKILKSNHNHVILLRNYAGAIKTGMEQRDYAILYGASGVITLIYSNEKFVFPNEAKEFFTEESELKQELVKKLKPQENDVIIIATASDAFVAEVSAKNSALSTIALHEHH